MKYKCTNSSCKDFDKEIEYVSVEYKVVGGRFISKLLECPKCGMDRIEINENDIPISEKNITINEFSSMSQEGRRESLKKRSHEHFEKNIKETKNRKINDAVKNFRNV